MKNGRRETNAEAVARSARYLSENPARRAWLNRRMQECARQSLRRVEALGGAASPTKRLNGAQTRAAARRRMFTAAAEAWRPGQPFPEVEYTEVEHETWRRAAAEVWEAHRRWACEEIAQASERLDLLADRVPGLGQLDLALSELTGFRLEPVAGLVQPEAFFGCLGERRFPTTLYVRDLSNHAYTPEPDLIHEVLGHVVSLAHPRIAELYHRFGVAAGQRPEQLDALERVFWHALEFGVVEAEGRPKALGAGLLSSSGELAQIEQVAHLDWDVSRMAQTPFVTTEQQPRLFMAPGFDQALEGVEAWLEEVSS